MSGWRFEKCSTCTRAASALRSSSASWRCTASWSIQRSPNPGGGCRVVEMRSLPPEALGDNQSILVSFQAQVDNRPMPLTRLTFRQIEAFVLVSEVRSFSVAAAQLGLTVQAVSQLVAELEATVGF